MDNSERDDTIEFELNSGSPWVEFHDDGSPPHVADDWETQAVDVSFGHRTEFFYTHKLVRTWPFFAKLLNEVRTVPLPWVGMTHSSDQFS